MGLSLYNIEMDKTKYKSVVVSTDTYKLIKALSEDTDRSLSKTLSRLVDEGVSAEAGEALLDCQLKSGGTPRLRRLLKDLEWFRKNAGAIANGEDGFYILDIEESRSVDLLLDALHDICG